MLKTDSLIFYGYIKYFTAEQILQCCVVKGKYMVRDMVSKNRRSSAQ